MSAGPRGAEDTHGRGEAMRGGGCFGQSSDSYTYTYSTGSEDLPSEEQRQGRGEKRERAHKSVVAESSSEETLHLSALDEDFDEELILGPEAHAEDRLHAEVTAALERSEQRQQQEQQSKRQRAEESGSLRGDVYESLASRYVCIRSPHLQIVPLCARHHKSIAVQL